MATLRINFADFIAAFLPVARAQLFPRSSPLANRIPSLQQLQTTLIPATLLPIPSLLGDLWDGLLNAVPKKKTSHMKKRHRQLASGKHLKDVTALNKCSSCGRAKRAHVLCPYCVQSKGTRTCSMRLERADFVPSRHKKMVGKWIQVAATVRGGQRDETRCNRRTEKIAGTVASEEEGEEGQCERIPIRRKLKCSVGVEVVYLPSNKFTDLPAAYCAAVYSACILFFHFIGADSLHLRCAMVVKCT